TTLIPGPDPRWGMQSPLDVSNSIRTPSGLNLTSTQTRAMTLSSPTDPLSLITQTDTFGINGRNYTSVYTAASRTFNSTTPEGRQRSLTIDAQGRVTRAQLAAFNPATYAYDARG